VHGGDGREIGKPAVRETVSVKARPSAPRRSGTRRATLIRARSQPGRIKGRTHDRTRALQPIATHLP
jgi:hypothetical protein